MKNKQILANYDALVQLKSKDDIRLPVKVSYAVTRNSRILEPIVEDIETLRNKIITEYGEPVPNQPGMYREKPGQDPGVLYDKIEELMNVETEVPIQKISIEDLDGLSFSFSEIDALYFMIEGEE
ncbi:MAG: hypothetical protein NC548_25635 [Lachnospiraceae bacterium]|nr:hypothetical protein [Lachnospiraceae bacterium]